MEKRSRSNQNSLRTANHVKRDVQDDDEEGVLKHFKGKLKLDLTQNNSQSNGSISDHVIEAINLAYDNRDVLKGNLEKMRKHQHEFSHGEVALLAKITATQIAILGSGQDHTHVNDSSDVP